MCSLCNGVSDLGQIKLKILKEVSRLKIKSVQITAYHSKLKHDQPSLKNKCTNLMGSTRRKLRDILEKKLGFSRSDYHSNCFVGNHCDRIVAKYEVITEVLESKPEIKKKYDEFFVCPSIL